MLLCPPGKPVTPHGWEALGGATREEGKDLLPQSPQPRPTLHLGHTGCCWAHRGQTQTARGARSVLTHAKVRLMPCLLLPQEGALLTTVLLGSRHDRPQTAGHEAGHPGNHLRPGEPSRPWPWFSVDRAPAPAERCVQTALGPGVGLQRLWVALRSLCRCRAFLPPLPP